MTATNLIGLTIGISSFLILFLHVANEKSYDKHFTDHQRIYRATSTPSGQENTRWARSLGIIQAAAPGIPEIEQYTQFSHAPIGTIQIGEYSFQQEDILSVDSAFINLFSVSTITGELSEISKPNTAFISEDFARKYFKDANPIGQSIEIKELQYTRDLGSYEIRGIIKNTPPKTHFNYHILLSQKGGLDQRYAALPNRKIHWVYNYMKLKAGTNPSIVANKLKNYYNTSTLKDSRGPSEYQFNLTPLLDIHLNSNDRFEFKENNGKINIRLFATISFVILLVSLLNFINLTIAQLIKRSNEMGLKKVIGASKTQIIGQVLTEVFIFCLLSVILSFILIEVLRPVINQLFEIRFNIFYTEPIVYLSILLIFSICLGLSVVFVALYLNKKNSAIDLLAARNKYIGSKVLKSLLVVQVCIVIMLITSTLLVNKQIRFISKLSLGFDKENVVVLKLNDFSKNPAVFINELLNQTSVQSVGYTRQHFGYPTQNLPLNQFGIEGNAEFVFANYDYLKTMQIRLKLDRTSPSADTVRGMIINKHLHERLIEKHGSLETLDTYLMTQPLEPRSTRVSIIGVAENFNYNSAHESIGDFAFWLDERANWAKFIHIRLNPGDLQHTMKRIETKWKEHYPNQPFNSFFLDNQIDRQYKAESILSRILSVFSAIAIIICMISVCALSLFLTEQRTKEIGIRKVNGAHISQVILILNKEYIKWILIAFIIAVPPAWWAMENWLENFAYKTPLSWWIFALAGLLTLLIAVITVSLQSYRAAARNPIESLRYE